MWQMTQTPLGALDQVRKVSVRNEGGGGDTFSHLTIFLVKSKVPHLILSPGLVCRLHAGRPFLLHHPLAQWRSEV